MCWAGGLNKLCPIKFGSATPPYPHTRSGWLYLAAVLGLGLGLQSRKIVSWAMAPVMPVALTGLVISPCRRCKHQRHAQKTQHAANTAVECHLTTQHAHA